MNLSKSRFKKTSLMEATDFADLRVGGKVPSLQHQGPDGARMWPRGVKGCKTAEM